jgi:hypothetical protein
MICNTHAQPQSAPETPIAAGYLRRGASAQELFWL